MWLSDEAARREVERPSCPQLLPGNAGPTPAQIPMSESFWLTCAIVAVRSGCETSKRLTASRSRSMTP